MVLLSIFIPSYRIAFVEDSGGILSFTRKSDFEDYFIASQILSRGGDPYKMEDIESIKKQFSIKDLASPEKIKEFMKRIKGAGTYLYPPLTAFLLLPVSDLSYKEATVIFQTLSIMIFLLFFYVLYRQGRSSDASEFFFPALLSVLILYNFLNGNFLHGNVLAFLLFLSVSGFILSFRDETYLSVLGGFLIGAAVVIKITPVFFGLVLLGKKRFAAIAGMGIGTAAGVLLPALYTGFGENITLLQNWYVLIIDSFSKIAFIRPWANNQTFSAMIGKLFVSGSDMKQSAYGLPLFAGTNAMQAEDIRFYVDAARLLNLSAFVSGIAVSAYLLFRNWNKKNTLDVESMRLMYFAALLSLLTAGVSWYHAYGILLLPVFLRLREHIRGKRLLPGETLGLFLLSIFGFFTLFAGPAAEEALALYSVFTMICAGIAAYTAVLLVSRKHGF